MEIVVADEPGVVAADRIARRVRAALRRASTASVAMSGGSTAPPLIAALFALDLEWDRVGVWQVDERIAPDGDDDRNANQLVDLPCRVHLMPVTGRDLRAGARRYAASLPARFDVVHLGLGDDGHTASWPPGDADVVASPRPVELVGEFNGRRRMTLTPTVVNAARARLVLTVGAAKRPMVERWLLRDPDLPVIHVSRRSTTLVIDAAAAPRAEPERVMPARG